MIGYACSVIGAREANQDAFLILNDRGLYAVADGVGGGVRGDDAARMVVDGLERSALEPSTLHSAVLQIQKEIYSEAIRSVGEPIMGSTLSAVFVRPNLAHVCHVGDSRIYLHSSGYLQLLTEDHEYFDEGIRSNVLASYLGLDEDCHPLRIQERDISYQADDGLLLCTDGLYRQMSESRMFELIQQNQKWPDRIPKIMCDEAASYKYSDNVTIVWVPLQS